MIFKDVINNRRTSRVFTDKNVSFNKIKKILYSATIAPSARNRQPWKFYILNDNQKDHIMNMLFEWDIKNPKSRSSVKGSAEQIKSANKMIMIYRDKYKSKAKIENYYKPDYLSIGCAIENMCLQAVDLGLGSCILCDTLYIEKEIDDYLGIKDYEQICGFIVGYPIYNYPPKPKKELNDLILN